MEPPPNLGGGSRSRCSFHSRKPASWRSQAEDCARSASARALDERRLCKHRPQSVGWTGSIQTAERVRIRSGQAIVGLRLEADWTRAWRRVGSRSSAKLGRLAAAREQPAGVSRIGVAEPPQSTAPATARERPPSRPQSAPRGGRRPQSARGPCPAATLRPKPSLTVHFGAEFFVPPPDATQIPHSSAAIGGQQRQDDSVVLGAGIGERTLGPSL